MVSCVSEATPGGAMEGKRGGRIAHWIFGGSTLLFLVWYGVAGVRRAPEVVATITRLGYPWYFCYLIGTGKLLEAATLAYPRTGRFREWAYAGITAEMLSAFASHSFSGDAAGLRVAPLAILAIVAAAYWFDPYRIRGDKNKI
jgi:hypothetical protein